MGLLDGLAGQVLGSLSNPSGAASGGMVAAVTGLVNQYPGGLPGLIAAFERGGLGAIAASWVGTGANLPITPDQLKSVLGNQSLQSIGESLGFTPEQVSSHLAELLPQVVDKLTPNGEVTGLGGLGSLLGSLGR